MPCTLWLQPSSLFSFACSTSYYYLGSNKTQWPIDEPPKMRLALIMLAVLLTSSVVLHWGEGNRLKRARYGVARIAISVNGILIGLVFMVLQSYEYRDHWKTLTPFSDSYGSIFYTITSFHALHVVVGILLLGYVAALPKYGPTVRASLSSLPHRGAVLALCGPRLDLYRHSSVHCAEHAGLNKYANRSLQFLIARRRTLRIGSVLRGQPWPGSRLAWATFSSPGGYACARSYSGALAIRRTRAFCIS